MLFNVGERVLTRSPQPLELPPQWLFPSFQFQKESCYGYNKHYNSTYKAILNPSRVLNRAVCTVFAVLIFFPISKPLPIYINVGGSRPDLLRRPHSIVPLICRSKYCHYLLHLLNRQNRRRQEIFSENQPNFFSASKHVECVGEVVGPPSLFV